MPDRLYISRIPPKLGDRILAHPGSVAIGVWSIVAGVVLVFDSATPEFTASRSLDRLPDWPRLWIAGTLLVGGVLVCVSLLRTWTRIDLSWRLEQGGWWILNGSWLAVATVFFWSSPTSILSWGSVLLLVMAGALRCQAVRITERKTRAAKGA